MLDDGFAHSLSPSPWSGHTLCWNQQGETSRDVKQTSKIGFYTRGNEWIHGSISVFFACLLRLDISCPRTCHVMSCLVDSCLGMLKASFLIAVVLLRRCVSCLSWVSSLVCFHEHDVMGMLLLQLFRRALIAVVLELTFPLLRSL